MLKNVILIILVLVIGTLYFGRAQGDKIEAGKPTFVEQIRLMFDKDYETGAQRIERTLVEDQHERNLQLLWSKNYVALANQYSNSYTILGENKTTNFVEEVKKEADNPLLKKDVNQLFDFSTLTSYNYKEMMANGFEKEIGAGIIKEGDFFVSIQPNKNSPDSAKLESFAALYRKINGEWIAIGGFR